MNTATETAPSGIFSIRLSPEELASPELRHRVARAHYSQWGFETVAEAQSFADSIAALADGEPVSNLFREQSEAEAVARRAAAERAVATSKAWAAQQQFAAAVARRDRADQRLRTGKGNLDYWRESAALPPPDWGTAVEHQQGIGWAVHCIGCAHNIDDIERRALPAFEAELKAAQAAVVALQQPTKASTATKAAKA